MSPSPEPADAEAPRRTVSARHAQPQPAPSRRRRRWVLLGSGLALTLAAVGAVVVVDPSAPRDLGLIRSTAGWVDSSPNFGPSPSPTAPASRPGSSSRLPGGSAPRASRSPAPTTSGPPMPWSVVGLGDSVTAGTACGCTPFVQRYADLTAQRTGRVVHSRNLGVSGLTSSGLLSMLGDGSDAAGSVAAADIDLVTIGANDVAETMQAWSDGSCGQSCLDAAAAALRVQATAVVNRIIALRAGRPTEILVTTYWNVVQDGEVARELFTAGYQQVSDGLTREVNAALCDAVQKAQPGAGPGGGDTVLCVDLYAPFKGDGAADPTALLAADGDHPSDAGHQLIATTLAGVGWAALEG